MQTRFKTAHPYTPHFSQKSIKFETQEKVIKKLTSISLLTIIVVASIGLNFNTHVCQGAIKSVGVYIPAESCSEMAVGSCTETTHEDGINRLPCCTNLNFSAPQSQFEENVFVSHKSLHTAAIAYAVLVDAYNSGCINTTVNRITDDPPDWPQKRIQADLQVFII